MHDVNVNDNQTLRVLRLHNGKNSGVLWLWQLTTDHKIVQLSSFLLRKQPFLRLSRADEILVALMLLIYFNFHLPDYRLNILKGLNIQYSTGG